MKIDTIENRMCLGDSDNDGWCDTIDPCPNTPGVNCPESDIDHDGIPDDEDDCPNDPGTSYYNGCPAPGEKDTDGDRVIDTYDHCPNQAGPASNNGCPLPENCLCKDREDVKKLLSDLGVQEDLIQQEEDLIEEKRGELSNAINDYTEAEREYKEYWHCPISDYDIVGLLSAAISWLVEGTAEGGIMGLLLFKCYDISKPMDSLNKARLKVDELTDVVEHHEGILKWRIELKEDLILQIKERCPCACP